jgi:hypothetical protein
VRLSLNDALARAKVAAIDCGSYHCVSLVDSCSCRAIAGICIASLGKITGVLSPVPTCEGPGAPWLVWTRAHKHPSLLAYCSILL